MSLWPKRKTVGPKTRSYYNIEIQSESDINPFDRSLQAFSQPLITHSLNSPTFESLPTPQLPILMDHAQSESLQPDIRHNEHKIEHHSMDEHGQTLPMPHTQVNRQGYFDVDDSMSLNNSSNLDSFRPPSPMKHPRFRNKKSKRKKQKSRFAFSISPQLRAPWNENVKDLLLRKLRNKRGKF